MNTNTTFRQGDVLIIPLSEFPAKVQNLQPVTNLIVAHGEATGHMHTVVGEALVEEHGDDIFFEVKSPTQLTHQEHDAIALAPGKYRKVHQKEHIPGSFRRVAD
jgi:hypothetical protein